MSQIAIFVDFGSTFTKAAAFDLEKEIMIGSGRSVSTAAIDITIGLKSALHLMEKDSLCRCVDKSTLRLACSSAAGGLRLAVVGLVPELSLKAGKLAALGAGAKLVGNYSYKLNKNEIKNLEKQNVDIVLLVGGTDGGNEEVIIHNAKMLSQSNLTMPMVIAGNKNCTDEIDQIFKASNKQIVIVDNVLKDLNTLSVDPCRTAIREIFIKRIIKAKGLKKAEKLLDGVVMPTPMAVLKAAEIISDGHNGQAGIGETILIDIGGATIDVHSIASGESKDQNVLLKGIKEPYTKRSVEGDLGIRYNALSILDYAKSNEKTYYFEKNGTLEDIERKVRYLSENIGLIPQKKKEYLLDACLARVACEIAMERHAGCLEQVYTPYGTSCIQYGKDLTGVRNIIGTGGIFAKGINSSEILEGALFSKKNPSSLKPLMAELFIDRKYILYAVGLMAEYEPEKALRIGKKYLHKLV